MHDRAGRRAALLFALALTITIAVGALALAISSFGTDAPGTPGSERTAASTPTASLSQPSVPASVSPPSASTATIQPPLPGLVGSIGDSISVAFDADSFGPAPAHEWTMGTATGDGVYSLLERFRALGANPVVADTAVAGARMVDAAGQARRVVAAASGLPAGSAAFVTIELGGNDACAATPAAAFETRLDDAIAVLRNGLPAGSRLLILSVPNIVHLRELTASLPAAQDVYSQFSICGSYLGSGVTSAQLRAGLARIRAYNEILARVCAGVEATDGTAGRLHCRSDQQGAAQQSMFGSNFTLADVSPLDYFHPSLAGQAKIAAGAWSASYWSSVSLPAGPS